MFTYATFFKKRLFLYALLAGAICLNVYFRMNTLLFPQVKSLARQEVYLGLRDQFEKTVAEAYPNSNYFIKAKAEKLLFDDYLSKKKAAVNEAIAQKSLELKGRYQNERGWTYLLETDSYRWQRRVESFLKHGSFGTVRHQGQDYDGLMFYPQGALVEPQPLHYAASAYFYKALNWINPKLALADCLALYPVVLSAVVVGAVFLTASLAGISYAGGCIASTAIGLSVLFLERTMLGWFDTDPYQILLPLLIMSCIAHAFSQSALPRYGWLAAAAVLVGVYSGLWWFWWLPFTAIVLGLALFLLESALYDKESAFSLRVKQAAGYFLFFLAVSYLSVMAISGISAIVRSFAEIGSYMRLRNGLTLDEFWPNIAFSISELQKLDMVKVMHLLGGPLVFYGGLFGLLLWVTIARPSRAEKQKRYLSFALFTWLVVSMVLVKFGVRFLIFLIIPLGIALGNFFDVLIAQLLLLIDKIRAKTIALPVAYSIIFLALQAWPVQRAAKTSFIPVITDEYWQMLAKVKETTPLDAVITASWDEGDYIMTLAERATLHDTSWQYTPRPYWISRAFLSHNEQEAIGIMRMLNAAGTKGFDTLCTAVHNDRFHAMQLINKMFVMNKQECRIFLKDTIKNDSEIEKILEYMYEVKHPSYLLISYFTASIIPYVSIIGSWDFNRLDMWQQSRRLSAEGFVRYAEKKFAFTKAYAEEMFDTLLFMDGSDAVYWIAPKKYHVYGRNSQSSSKASDDVVLFDDGLMVDIKQKKAYFRDDPSAAWLKPGRLLIQETSLLEDIALGEGDAKIAAVLSKAENGEYKGLLCDSPLADSIFFKLYFMNGYSLKHFTMVHQESQKVFLYKIDFDAS